jgi:hypothetical protein
LLSVHGAESASVYSVIRYNLEFWECRKCTDQSALLIVEEKIASRWRRNDLYYESYRSAAGVGGWYQYTKKLFAAFCCLEDSPLHSARAAAPARARA